MDNRYDDPEPTYSVTVQRPGDLLPFEVHDAIADVFELDEVTVSYLDPVLDEANGPAKVFPAGTWLSATVYDRQGNVVAHFVSDLAAQQAQARRAASLPVECEPVNIPF